MVTVNVQVPTLSLGSMKLKVTSVVPTENELPDRGSTLRKDAVPELSVAVASGKETGRKEIPWATGRLMSIGQFTSGGITSSIESFEKKFFKEYCYIKKTSIRILSL